MKYVVNTYTGSSNCIEAALATRNYANSIEGEAVVVMTRAEIPQDVPSSDIIEVDGLDLYFDERIEAGAVLKVPEGA